MKRQGRQHGMVRTYPISSEPWSSGRKQRGLDELASPPTAGLFSKVSSKPTNHSKFTGKCGRSKCHDCHIHPASKSKDKAKGALKMRSSSDVVSSYRLITWRVVDSASGFKVSGFSATGVLDYLDRVDDYDYDYEGQDSDHDHVGFDGCYDHDHDLRSYDDEMKSHGVEIEEIDGCDDSNDGADDDDDDRMSFCEVGFVWEAVEGDESWCLVEEI
ncbi:uncharacterized protein LOC131008740 [Salvia miltiorrhiza]|uniref:uncharacterized protein LOC131008740 n=1 Tax=Salvia miltiorrhiza TaxID=226208 RepID=UPI0025AB9135|nr:uncharacterized protein LOC131008740 [Salvia miltiorrhiza]